MEGTGNVTVTSSQWLIIVAGQTGGWVGGHYFNYLFNTTHGSARRFVIITIQPRATIRKLIKCSLLLSYTQFFLGHTQAGKTKRSALTTWLNKKSRTNPSMSSSANAVAVVMQSWCMAMAIHLIMLTRSPMDQHGPQSNK